MENFRTEKSKFDREVAKWDDTGNDVIVLAKQMCMIMMEMTDFTRYIPEQIFLDAQFISRFLIDVYVLVFPYCLIHLFNHSYLNWVILYFIFYKWGGDLKLFYLYHSIGLSFYSYYWVLPFNPSFSKHQMLHRKSILLFSSYITNM